MTHKKKNTAKIDDVRPYLDGVAKKLVDDLYGADGPAWGTQLTDIEEVLLSVRLALSQKMLDLSLQRQASALSQQPPDTQACPGCHQPLCCDQANSRTITTQVGETSWQEPEAYCRRCRRAFFPSVQESGH